jgi:CHAT domain-containing protein
LYRSMGRYEEAEPFYKKSFTLTRTFLIEQIPGLSEKEKSNFLSTKRPYFENIWGFAEKAYSELPESAGLGYDALLVTKAVLLDGSKKMRERILRSGDRELVNTFRRWLGLKERIGRYLSGDTSVLGAQTYEELEKEANDLEKELSRRSEAYRRGFERKLYAWEQVRASLMPGEAAVELVRYEWGEGEDARPTYAAYILRGDRKKVDLVVFPKGETMEGEALDMYRGLTSPTKSGLLEYLADGRDPEREVYEAYWAPLEDALKGIKRVYLSPDGVYNLINLGTLKGEKGYLSDTVDLRILTTTRTLVERVEEAASKEKAGAVMQSIPALMGYPAYGLGVSEQEALARSVKERAGGEELASRDTGFGEVDFRGGVSVLPGTKEEVEAITGLYESFGETSGTYLWEEALEEQVKVLESPKVLHIATHGFFQEDGSWLVKKVAAPGEMLAAGEEAYEAVSHPLMQSGLLLAGCEDTLRGGTGEAGQTGESGGAEAGTTVIDDGILTAYEAMSLDLDNTDLVVLSACETGRGEILNGEGVYGLQRAFQVAGANAVIMSLWKVDDEATKEFMITFYRNYLSGGDSRTAYLETVREMRTREQYDRPFYWGAFVYVE